MIKIKNLEEGSRPAPKGCRSWLDYWFENVDDIKPRFCCVCGCLSDANVGAHVVKADGTKEWYIIPMCTYHNNQHGQILEIDLDEDDLLRIP